MITWHTHDVRDNTNPYSTGTTHRWLCADQLAFALANAAIRLANYTMQPAALDILMDTYSMLKEDLAHSDGIDHSISSVHQSSH